MYAASVAVGLTLLTGAAAELSIIYPGAGSTWFKNDSALFNWTSTEPDKDPKFFRVMLSGGSAVTPQELANQVPVANEFYRVGLGQVSPAEGFTLSFTNTSNSSQVFAKSEGFKIEQGTAPTTTTNPPSSASSTGAGSKEPPPNVDASSSSSANPFASDSAGKGSSAGMVAAPVVAAGALAAAVIAAL